MAGAPLTHRKSQSSSSIFRKSPLSTASISNPTSTTHDTPVRKRSSVTTRLARLTIPTSDNDGNIANQLTGSPRSRGSSLRLSASGSPNLSPVIAPPSPIGSRSSLSRKGNRPNSIFGSLRSFKISENDVPKVPSPISNHKRSGSLARRDHSGHFESSGLDVSRNATVLCHGEAQTDTGLFWKKREYLVLTETHLIRFKNQTKASEVFATLPKDDTRSTFPRHGSSPSLDSDHDFRVPTTELASETATSLPLEYIVGIYRPDDIKHNSVLEIMYFDKTTEQGLSLDLHLPDVSYRDRWLLQLRQAANTARLLDLDPIPRRTAEYIARAVEREQDYDPATIRIYKVVKHASISAASKSFTEESPRTAPTVCFLVIGVHKVHLIALPRNNNRSSPALVDHNDCENFGILNLTCISVGEADDGFVLGFRTPLKPARSFQLSSSAATEIAMHLRQVSVDLRPEWCYLPFAFVVPGCSDNDTVPVQQTVAEDHNGFDRTLTGFCAAYGVTPASIRYMISYSVEDSPRFELLPPARVLRSDYSALELLAVFRSLRYNKSFQSISFSPIRLDILNELLDPHGIEYASISSPLPQASFDDFATTPLLVQEIRALAHSSAYLRRLDVSYCFPGLGTADITVPHPAARGSGVLEALAPLCKGRSTSIDWLVLNGVKLQGRDLELLIDLASDNRSHFRAIEIKQCGLNEDATEIFMDALQAQANTLEVIDISYNKLRIDASSFSRLLTQHRFLRRLDLSGLAILTSEESLLDFSLLSSWRVERLGLAGLDLNIASIDSLCRYLSHPQSKALHDLDLSNCSLSGSHVASLLHACSSKHLHLNVSENNLEECHDRIVSAIVQDSTPTHLSMRSIEYESSEQFRRLLAALANNHSLQYLDISRISLPGEASDETRKALTHVFMNNNTLKELDISGEDARLEPTRLTGIAQTLYGLEKNHSLNVLRIQNQSLGLRGASMLADVIKNNTCLREIYCENNGISLSGFTDLVNALVMNTTLQYLPSLMEGKHAALMQTEQQIKEARTKDNGIIIPTQSPDRPTLAPRRKTIVRAAGSGFGIGTFNTGRQRAENTNKVGAVSDWSEGDIQAAMQLVSEGWETQAVRLEKLLDRNRRIAGGTLFEEAEILSGVQERAMGGSNTIDDVLSAVGAMGDMRSPGSRYSSFDHEETVAETPLSAVDIDTSPVFERCVFDLPSVSVHAQRSDTSATSSGFVLDGLGLDLGDGSLAAGFFAAKDSHDDGDLFVRGKVGEDARQCRDDDQKDGGGVEGGGGVADDETQRERTDSGAGGFDTPQPQALQGKKKEIVQGRYAGPGAFGG